MPRWLTQSEMAEHLNVSPPTLAAMVKSGAIPAPKRFTARTIRYDLEAVDNALSGKQQSAGAATLDQVEW